MYNDRIVNKEENELINKTEPGNIQNQPKSCKRKYQEWNLGIYTDWGATGEWKVEIITKNR